MSTTKGGAIGGHALTGVLTGLWSFGMGNVAYNKLSKKKNKERIVLRTDDEQNIRVKEADSAGPTELIRELKQLNEEGLITNSEFEDKKQELLDEM
ncbi:SHOCT domain-containing protein [Natrinema halophilum]|uniref:SHOCT domain-containing protein n=1 Tax=Natrinema halophilum TaxID=1699371 RepID=A0A7D5KEK3_9EURY|nr:SHOCT domain-containing protein [Natrinema halophilum]QLG50241.1 SHOCT domain-containing protein [Natrinema halophilum]